MQQARNLILLGLGTLGSFVGPMLLGVMIVLLSTLAFFYTYRNDMLIFAAQERNPRAVRVFATIGGSAAAATEIFPETALITYLHSLQGPPHPDQESADIVETLIRAGASLTERNLGGWTPLMLAAAAGNATIVDCLLRHGAEIDARAVGGETTEGMTALMAAAMRGHTPVVRLLVERGANPNLRARAGFTALTLAHSKGFKDCSDFLTQKGALPLRALPPAPARQVAEVKTPDEPPRRMRLSSPALRVAPSPRQPTRYPEK